MSGLEELLRRVEAATGPDKELDDAIWKALCWEALYQDFPRGWPFTASLDATIALVEKRLPGWAWHISKIEGVPSRYKMDLPDCDARLWLPAVKTQALKQETFAGAAATSPLALLGALLRAEISNRSGST